SDPKSSVRRPLTATLDHVGGCVAAVDVEAVAAKRDEQPPGAAARVEHWATQVLLVELELRCRQIGRRPVVGYQAVVPCTRFVRGHRVSTSRQPSRTSKENGGRRSRTG